MSDIVLYRKYRPKNFKEVLGQEHIVKILEGALARDSISHAYLFSGPRGTGKTSVARIFATALGVSGNDLYEIDAASNRGIDDIRLLREGVAILPFESPYKVYIVDEAHMLTKEAWNALLKTLEEPPRHVIFIFATTEIEKVPETILSRCESHSFRQPGRDALRKVAISVAKKEGFHISEPSAELVALLSEGSFRDCYGILQKIMGVSSDRMITDEEIADIAGAPRLGIVNDFVKAIHDRNVSTALRAVHKVSEGGGDIKVFFKLALERIRLVLLLRFAPADFGEEIKKELSEEDFVLISGFASTKTSGIDTFSLITLLHAYDFVGRSIIPALPIEVAVVKLFGENIKEVK